MILSPSIRVDPGTVHPHIANKTQALHTLTCIRFITALGSFRINLNARAGELTRLPRSSQACPTIAGKSYARIGSVVVLVWTYMRALATTGLRGGIHAGFPGAASVYYYCDDMPSVVMYEYQ